MESMMSTDPKDTHDDDAAAATAATTDNKNKIQLGFSVEFEDEEHRRSVGHHSPCWIDWDGGQIGGRPSWLNPRDIPHKPIECQLCKTPMVFVCQLYAPLEIEINPNAFHRSFYVFACPNTGSSDDDSDDGNCEGDKCSMATTGTVRVFRTQLPKKNPFYPERMDAENATNDNDDVDDLESSSWTKHRPETWGVRLCVASGQRGHGKCPIQRLEFCSKYHQKEYKKHIYDKVKVSNKIKDKNDNDDDDDDLQGIDLTHMPSMMADSELVVEEEPEYDTNDSPKPKSTLFQPSTNGDGDGDGDDGEDDENLEQCDLNAITGAAAETVTKDEVTMQFYDRINSLDNVKSQCLRYLRWPDLKVCEETNTPLWIRSDFQPPSSSSSSSENNIPPCCDKCGAPRKFEFQLMPQMIHYLLLNKTNQQQQPQQNETRAGDSSTTTKEEDGDVTDAAAIDALRTATAIMDETPPEQIPPDLAETTEKAAATMRKKLMGSSTRSSSTPGWGVVAVYTCTKSCGGDDILDGNGADDDLGAYIEEFAWRQPSLD